MRLRMNLATESPALITASVLAAFTAWIWSRAPERMPVHWDLRGVPDAFGSRFDALFYPPGIMLLLYLVLAFAPTLASAARDARFERAYHAFRHGIVALLALVHLMLSSRAIGLRVPDLVTIAFALFVIALLTVRLVVRARAAAKRGHPPR